MKISVFALLTVLACNHAFANGVERVNGYREAAVKKSFDGLVASCQEKRDIGTQAYRLEAVGDMQQNSALLRLTSYVCAEAEAGFKLRRSLPLRVLPNGYEISQSRIMIVDERYRVVAEIPVNENSAVTEFRLDGAQGAEWYAFVRSVGTYAGESTWLASGTFNLFF